jgi:hypothetical protein
MRSNYWTIINLLVSGIEKGKVDVDELKKARLLLCTELDRCFACNLPADETKCLISVLDGLYDKVSDNE